MFDWSDDKDVELRATRGISFQDIVLHVERGNVLAVADDPNCEKYPKPNVHRSATIIPLNSPLSLEPSPPGGCRRRKANSYQLSVISSNLSVYLWGDGLLALNFEENK